MASDFQADIDAIAGIDAARKILDVAARTTGMGWTCIARVTEDRWVNCMTWDRLGWNLQPGAEIDITHTVCDRLRRTREPVVIDEVARDPEWADHFIPAKFGFQSYISVPILRSDGSFFGTLCALDPEPRKVDRPEIRQMFHLFAELIAQHLDVIERARKVEQALEAERREAELREQFIAVLGHDLRSPLAGIVSGARVLGRMGLEVSAARTAQLIQASAMRAATLVDNLLDFARGRLGGGVPIARDPEAALKPILQTVIAEQEGAAERAIEADLAFEDPIPCDPDRLGQLFANLLGNAVAHGAPEGPIRVGAETRGALFELWVSNPGAPIPAERIGALFKPFVRDSQGKGLGLGLYIASQIAEAHGGAITVASGPVETRFTFAMPLT